MNEQEQVDFNGMQELVALKEAYIATQQQEIEKLQEEVESWKERHLWRETENQAVSKLCIELRAKIVSLDQTIAGQQDHIRLLEARPRSHSAQGECVGCPLVTEERDAADQYKARLAFAEDFINESCVGSLYNWVLENVFDAD